MSDCQKIIVLSGQSFDKKDNFNYCKLSIIKVNIAQNFQKTSPITSTFLQLKCIVRLFVNPAHVFKKGSKHDKENYRPIIFISIICRLLERIIKNEIVKYLDTNAPFSNDQYDFRAKLSCVT